MYQPIAITRREEPQSQKETEDFERVPKKVGGFRCEKRCHSGGASHQESHSFAGAHPYGNEKEHGNDQAPHNGIQDECGKSGQTASPEKRVFQRAHRWARSYSPFHRSKMVVEKVAYCHKWYGCVTQRWAADRVRAAVTTANRIYKQWNVQSAALVDRLRRLLHGNFVNTEEIPWPNC